MTGVLRTSISLLISLSLVCLLSACTRDSSVVIRGETMGTGYSVQISSPPSELDTKQLHQEIESRLRSINKVMSTYDPESAISLFNQSSKHGWHTTAPELVALVARSIALAELTSNAFDVTIAPLVNLWGFGKDPAIIQPPARTAIENSLNYVGINKIRADVNASAIWKQNARVMIDLSAIAKGYAVDQIASILRSHQIENFMAEIGGEIHARGRAPHGDYWHIGIESPVQSTGKRKITLVLKLENMAIATSGDYRNFFLYEGKRYSHTIDPAIGIPANTDLASVSVLHPDAETADALATAMMVMGVERSRKFANKHQVPAVFIRRTDNEYRVETNTWIDKFLTDIN